MDRLFEINLIVNDGVPYYLVLIPEEKPKKMGSVFGEYYTSSGPIEYTIGNSPRIRDGWFVNTQYRDPSVPKGLEIQTLEIYLGKPDFFRRKIHIERFLPDNKPGSSYVWGERRKKCPFLWRKLPVWETGN